MDRRLDDEDRAFQRELRDFLTTSYPRRVRETVAAGVALSREDIIESQRALHAAGYAVPGWPVEWGGRDWSDLRRHIWATELQRAHAAMPLAFNVGMVGPVIAAFGTREQKERFLPATANLDIWWCQGFSEPDAGSDLASLRTTAVRDGEEYVVNGQKIWTTLGQHADWIFCLVRTDPDAKKQKGISFLVFEMSTPGVTIRPIKLIDGGVEVNEVFFDDVRVPADQLIGEENHGWDYAKFLLGNERIGVAPVGSVKARLAQVKEHADLTDPLLAARVAELEADLVALELTVLRVAGGSHDGKPDPASSILKLRGTELLQEVVALALEVAGPMALEWAHDDVLPQWATTAMPTYLNYRKATIYGGSSEVQREIISGTILGLSGKG